MKVITINVCGIRSSQKKGIFDWLSRSKADHICMQETRALEEQIDNDNFILKGYTRYMNIAVKKGYSGVAIYSKHKPSEIISVLKRNKLKIRNIKGLEFNPVENRWSLTNNTNINYFLVAQK